jgi:hypothetical protein
MIKTTRWLMESFIQLYFVKLGENYLIHNFFQPNRNMPSGDEEYHKKVECLCSQLTTRLNEKAPS